MIVRLVSAEEIRATIRFEDLIEPVSRAFQDSSAGRATSGLIVMFPAASPDSGDVYVKTGTLHGRRVFIVKVSPWFKINLEQNHPQGGFIGVFDATANGDVHRAIQRGEYRLEDVTGEIGAVLAGKQPGRTAISDITVAKFVGLGVQDLVAAVGMLMKLGVLPSA